MNKLSPLIKVQDEHRTNYFFVDNGVFLHHLTLKPGRRHCVYRSSDYKRDPSNTEGINAMKSVTVLPPPGQVIIHSPAMDRPGQWIGTYEQVGAGIVFETDFYYEAIVDSDFFCATWMPDRLRDPGAALQRVLLQPGESFTFEANTELAISMLGTDQFSAFTGEPGEQFTCDQITLLAVVETLNV
jgi:hypothetical protein